MSETWGVLAVIEWADGDDVSFQVMGKDLTKKQADKLMNAIPAIANSSSRIVKSAYLRVMEERLIQQLEAEAQP